MKRRILQKDTDTVIPPVNSSISTQELKEVKAVLREREKEISILLSIVNKAKTSTSAHTQTDEEKELVQETMAVEERIEIYGKSNFNPNGEVSPPSKQFAFQRFCRDYPGKR